MARIRAFTALPLAVFVATTPVSAESYAPSNQGSFPDRPMVDSSGVMHFLVQGTPYKVPGVQADPSASSTPLAAGTAPATPGSLTATVSGTTITVRWGLVTANPAVTSYLVFKNGSNTPLATVSATTNSYADTGQAPGTTDSYAIFAINSIGNSPYVSSVSATVPVATPSNAPAAAAVAYYDTITALSTPTPRYAGLAAGGGANVPTAVAALPNNLRVSEYAGAGDNVAFNTTMGFAPSGTALSVSQHFGKYSENDFTDINYDLDVPVYNGFKIYNAPLAWNNGTVGGLLASAATGTASPGTYPTGGALDADYLNNAKRMMYKASFEGQDMMIVRIGWEFNNNNGASSPWYAGGQEANYAAAFRHYASTIQAWAKDFQNSTDASYGLVAVKKAGGVGTLPTLKIIFCWNLGGDNPAPSDPGAGYYDLVGVDIYDLVSNGIGDPTAWFNNVVLNGQWGLTYLSNYATSHNVRIAFPEFGISRNDGGVALKLMYQWIANSGLVDMFTWWNSDGDYASNVVTGNRPVLTAWLQHLFNPVTNPVEPTDPPPAISATPGNGTMTVQIAPPPAWMSVQPTQVLLYEGTTAGGENLTAGSGVATLAVTSGGVSTTLNRTNGTTYYYKAAYKLPNGNVGFASAETSATPIVPASNTPAHYDIAGANGYAETPVPATYASSQTTPITVHITYQPSAKDLTNTDNLQLIGIWGDDGYIQSWGFYLNNNNRLAAFVHNTSNNYAINASTASYNFVAGSWYDLSMTYTPSTGQMAFTVDPAGHTGADTPLGTPASNSPISIASVQTDPGTHTAPTLRVAQTTVGAQALSGGFSRWSVAQNGVPVVNATVNATNTTDSVSGVVWTETGVTHGP